MTTWVYLASAARDDEATTFRDALSDNIVHRTTRDSRGNLIANVARMKPGDEILLAYRGKGPLTARVQARIAAPVGTPVDGTTVVERIGDAEVIHLEDVKEVEIPLPGSFESRNAIQRLTRREAAPEAKPLAPRLTAKAPKAPPEPLEDASLVLEGKGKPAFDAYMMVDWSSASEPCKGANSIWIAIGERDGATLREQWRNPPTRKEALEIVRNRLARWIEQGRRALVGMDFAFGYPRGFAQALGLTGTPWKAVLDHFAERVADDAYNQHNRDAFAAACNLRIADGPGPFWGCHDKAAGPTLTTKRVGVFTFPHHGLDEWRAADRRLKGLQSVWKLNQGVAVGGQTILGLKYLHELRFGSDPRLTDNVRLWPFETGWDATAAQVVVAEIFPSAIPQEPGLGSVRDLVQVRSCVRHAAREDDRGALAQRFARPDGIDDPAVRDEEGWILFA